MSRILFLLSQTGQLWKRHHRDIQTTMNLNHCRPLAGHLSTPLIHGHRWCPESGSAGNLLVKINPTGIPHSNCFAPDLDSRTSKPQRSQFLGWEFELMLLGKECWRIDPVDFGALSKFDANRNSSTLGIESIHKHFNSLLSCITVCKLHTQQFRGARLSTHPYRAKLLICHQPFFLLVPGRAQEAVDCFGEPKVCGSQFGTCPEFEIHCQ